MFAVAAATDAVQCALTRPRLSGRRIGLLSLVAARLPGLVVGP